MFTKKHVVNICSGCFVKATNVTDTNEGSSRGLSILLGMSWHFLLDVKGG